MKPDKESNDEAPPMAAWAILFVLLLFFAPFLWLVSLSKR